MGTPHMVALPAAQPQDLGVSRQLLLRLRTSHPHLLPGSRQGPHTGLSASALAPPRGPGPLLHSYLPLSRQPTTE